jgi:hypothetical protein
MTRLPFGFFALSLFVISAPAVAQVQTIGDLSFAVPDGWQYQAAADGGSMFLKSGGNFWIVTVHAPMPASADANADFKAAWKYMVLATPGYRNVPSYNPYDLSKTVGYVGKYYDDSNADHSTYTRLYTVETGKSVVAVMFISQNRQMLDLMEHMARAIVGSVRVAPLKASPIKTSITVSDLAGHWVSGLVTSIDFYNSAGQYQSNSLTAYNAGYTIAADGSFTYKFNGLLNNRPTTDDDSGVIELGGEFLVFKGHRRTTRYRFLNVQQGLDGTTVLTLLPPVEMSEINISRDSQYWSRPPKK